jgi:hypothetical protein
MKKNENLAICVVGNYLYLKRNLSRFINQVRSEGGYKGDIVILTSKYTPTFLIKLSNKKNVKYLKFKRIKFDRKTDKSLKEINTLGQPNRHIHKNFQWHKLHLFDPILKKWDYIFYIDINMTIHKNINPIFKIKPMGCLFANRDYSDGEHWDLEGQFDNTHKDFLNLKKSYDLSIKNYFQTGMIFYDTQIIETETKEEIIKLVKKYPYTRTNEQAIMNLFFIFEKGLFKELPGEVDGINTYSYWKHDNNTRITKQLVKKHK